MEGKEEMLILGHEQWSLQWTERNCEHWDIASFILPVFVPSFILPAFIEHALHSNSWFKHRILGSLVAHLIKTPAMQETWVRSLGWEDPLENGMATHSSILAQRIPYTRY